MLRTCLTLLPYPFALSVLFFAGWAFGRQARAVLQHGFAGVGNQSEVILFAGLGLSLAALATLFGLATGRRWTPLVFGAMATAVAAPFVFGSTDWQLIVNGYNYYAAFDWIASDRIQGAWLGLAALCTFGLTLLSREGAFGGPVDPGPTVVPIWATALYWGMTAWMTVQALNLASDYLFRRIEDLWQAILGNSYAPRLPETLVMTTAIAVALWLRSSVALWLVLIGLLGVHFTMFFAAANYWPGENVTSYRSFLLRHPALRLAEVAAIVALVRAGVLGPVAAPARPRRPAGAPNGLDLMPSGPALGRSGGGDRDHRPSRSSSR